MSVKKKANIKDIARAVDMATMNPKGFRKPSKKKNRRKARVMVEKIDDKIKQYERKN